MKFFKMNLKEALEIFEIDETISINIVKQKYRKLQKKFHPDVAIENKIDYLNKINEAYKFLINYLENYCIKIDQIFENLTDEEKLKRRFSEDWLSGKEI